MSEELDLEGRDPEDLLWTWHGESDFNDRECWKSHLITKRTNKFVYITRFGHNVQLNREELERDGMTGSRWLAYEMFYTTAQARVELGRRQAFLG